MDLAILLGQPKPHIRSSERKPMASKYWIKLYHEILDDPKMGRLPDALFRRAIEFFLIAGENNREGALPPLADMAWRLRADEARLYAQMEDLEALNILSRGADGCWLVAHFRERQEASPGFERVRRHRETAQKGEDDHPAPCNEAVTKRYTDTDADRDIEPDEKADADGGAESGGGILGDGLVKVFIERTEIPPFLGGKGRWVKALERLKQAGVEESDLEQAIDECRQKGLTIASLASVVNPAIIARSRRRAGRPEEDYRRYLKGEYGKVGR
ncbi:MAG: hypothetical protein MUO42_07665 [Anaerolineaceae bacterium]|nr:hypothetical protein [Anaerolineaceae bacterium]